MSERTYNPSHARPLVWLHGEIRTPPFSTPARLEAGFLLRQLQAGLTLRMPHSRAMPTIARGCHELRIGDGAMQWRIVVYLASDAVVVLDVFAKKTRRTPLEVIVRCRKRLSAYRRAGERRSTQ